MMSYTATKEEQKYNRNTDSRNIGVRGKGYYKLFRFKNDRSGETNRDFSNMLQDGFIYGAFKVTQGRGKLDCIDEGMTIMRAVAGLFWKTFVDKTEKNEMDFYNFFEMILVLMDRCDYHSTI